MDSPRKPAGAMKGKFNLSERECELLASAWLSAQNPQINWNKFSELAGFKNANSARACFGPLRKKLQEQFGEGIVSSAGKAGAATAKSYELKAPRAPKKKAAGMEDDATDGLLANAYSLQSPSRKRVKKDHAPAVEQEQLEPQQDEDDEEGLV